ncbi:MAG: SDR family NAD(P)-dependent oxidoreductase [Candidatus Latescibacteria bacterium]|nr:SDR family NAD(P)-dependent oxidoreductase [Candidatus Latescibacterota bacterium]
MTPTNTANDPVALITGAASGIGRAAAQRFARADIRVFCVDTDTAGVEETAHLIAADGGTATPHSADISQVDQVEAMARDLDALWGRLDCAVNNAGILGQAQITGECTPQNWDRVIGVNLSGMFYCMRAEIPRLLATQRPAIVNMSSIIGLGTAPTIPAYAASKYGVIGLTKTAAQEYDGRIAINAICPGAVATPMQEKWSGQAYGRTPEDIAEIAFWLCRTAPRPISGEALTDENWDQVRTQKS